MKSPGEKPADKRTIAVDNIQDTPAPPSVIQPVTEPLIIQEL
jgi:hypothetical protein